MRALLAVLVVTVAGCGGTGRPAAAPSPTSDPHRALWERSEPSSYEMTLTYTSQIGPRPMRVRVVAGRVVASEDLRTGDVPHSDRDVPLTVEGVFDLLARDQRDADEVDVVYDQTWGFPASVSVDPEKNAIDEEHAYALSDFRALTS